MCVSNLSSKLRRIFKWMFFTYWHLKTILTIYTYKITHMFLSDKEKIIYTDNNDENINEMTDDYNINDITDDDNNISVEYSESIEEITTYNLITNKLNTNKEYYNDKLFS